MQQQSGRSTRGAPAPGGYPSAPMPQPNYGPHGMGYGKPLIAGTPCYGATAYGTFFGVAGR